MTGTDERSGAGRFGAASPGARPERPSLEDLLTVRQPPRRGRRRMVLLIISIVGVLAVGAGGYLAGHFTAPAPPAHTGLLVTDIALPSGARLVSADLRVVTVQPGAGAPAGSLGPAAATGLLGMATRSALPAGTFLTRSLLAPAGAVPTPAQALVGLALKPGQLPASGLVPGQQVLIVLVPSSASAPAQSLITTTVWDVQGAAGSGMTLATVIVPVALATGLAGYAARGELALVATTPLTRPAPAVSPARPGATPHPTTSATHPTTSAKPHTKPSAKPSHHS